MSLTPERQDHLDALRRAVVSPHELPWLFDLALGGAARLTHADDLFVFWRAPDEPDAVVQRACLHTTLIGPCEVNHELMRRAQSVAKAWLAGKPPPAIDGPATFACTPPIVGSHKLGCLVAAWSDGGPAVRDEETRKYLGAVADFLGLALRSSAQAARGERWQRELALLDDVAKDCAEHSLDVALPSVLERVSRRMELHFAVMSFIDSDRRELVVGWGRRDGTFLPPNGRRYPDTGLPMEILRSRQPRRDLVDNLPDLMMRSRAREMGLVHIAGAPLMVRDRVIGILFGARRDRPIGDDDLRVLGAVGLQVAVAVDNSRLFAETEQRAADLELVHSVGTALAGTFDITVPMRETLVRLAEKFQLDGIRIYRARADRFESVMGAGPLGETMFESMRLDRNDPLMSKYHQLGRASDFDVSQLAEPSRSRLAARGIGRAGGVPLLIASDQVNDRSPHDVRISLGVLAFIRKSPTPFAHAELDLLDAVSGQLAIALRNADAREHIVRQERLAALGGLAALVAHEVRNPLGVIVHSMGLIGKLACVEGDARRAYDIILEEAARLDSIVTGILDYTRPITPRLLAESLDRVVRAAVASAQGALSPGESTRTVVEIPPDMPPVPMDERLLHQALVNLVANAYQALNGPGEVCVTCSAIPEKRRIRIVIGDTGPGLSDEARRRMFEPFFTTKAKGSGLGLAIVKGIVESHHGEIFVEPNSGGGTRFVVELPMDQVPDGITPSSARQSSTSFASSGL